MADLFLTETHRFWRDKLVSRFALLIDLINLDAPQIVKDTQKELIEKARSQMIIWKLVDQSTFEIDIVTGKVTIHDVTSTGRLLLALIHCEDDDSSEEGLL